MNVPQVVERSHKTSPTDLQYKSTFNIKMPLSWFNSKAAMIGGLGGQLSMSAPASLVVGPKWTLINLPYNKHDRVIQNGLKEIPL